jgi:hypothetical protein
LATKKGYESKKQFFKDCFTFLATKKKGYESEKVERFLHILGYILEPNLEIWQYYYYFIFKCKNLSKRKLPQKRKKTLIFSLFEFFKKKAQKNH